MKQGSPQPERVLPLAEDRPDPTNKVVSKEVFWVMRLFVAYELQSWRLFLPTPKHVTENGG